MQSYVADIERTWVDFVVQNDAEKVLHVEMDDTGIIHMSSSQFSVMQSSKCLINQQSEHVRDAGTTPHYSPLT